MNKEEDSRTLSNFEVIQPGSLNNISTSLKTESLDLPSISNEMNEVKPINIHNISLQMKDILEEMEGLKNRLTKAEREIIILHELLKVQDDITEETLAILPKNLKFINSNYSKEDKSRWSKKVSSKKVTLPTSSSVTPLMYEGHQWFGDAFLFELFCQIRGNRPKLGHWFNSVNHFQYFDDFANSLFAKKRFYHAVVLSIGYSNLFHAKPIAGAYFKKKLHALLNYINEHGAYTIKVLSLPPSRQMMNNEQYLRICQTTNRFLKTITSTHNYVKFINLDQIFIKNYDDDFGYFNKGEVTAQISDNLLMRKVNDEFEFYLESMTAQKVIKAIISCDLPLRTSSTSSEHHNDSNSHLDKKNAHKRRSSVLIEYPIRERPREKCEHDRHQSPMNRNRSSRRSSIHSHHDLGSSKYRSPSKRVKKSTYTVQYTSCKEPLARYSPSDNGISESTTIYSRTEVTNYSTSKLKYEPAQDLPVTSQDEFSSIPPWLKN